MAVATLTNPSRIKQPSWLADDSAGDSLRSVQANLGQYYDTNPLQQAAQQYSEGFANRAEMGFDAQARAAKNQAMRSGGRVGANFTKGGLMLGLQGNLNQMNYDYARLAAQMMAQQGQQAGQLAGQIADYGLGRQGLLSNYTQGQQSLGLQAQGMNQRDALARAQLAQQQAAQNQQNRQYYSGLDQSRYQFDQNFGQQTQNNAAQRAALALRYMGPGGFNYNMQGGMPLDLNDAAQYGRAQDFQRQRQSALNSLR